MPDEKILLLGCGFTLSRVAERLPPANFIATRSSKLDVRSKSSVEEFATSYPDIRVIVDSVPPIRDGEDAILGVRNICEVFSRLNVRRIIYLSTTGVFGYEDGRFVDEDTPPNPAHPWSRTRLESEELYREHFSEVVALRIPAIYGPGRGLGHVLKAGRYKLVENGERWTNRIHVEDLAEVIKCLAETPIENKLPPILCINDDESTLAKDVCSFYCNMLGLPMPGTITREEVEKGGFFTMMSSQRVSNTLMKSTTGITLKYPTYREGARTEFSTVE